MVTRRELLARTAAALSVGCLPTGKMPDSALITLQPDPTWLEELVSRVATTTGEPLGVESGWRWDGVMASVIERPAAKVRAELAELFHYGWSDSRTKPILSGGARIRNLEQGLRARMFGDSADRMAAYAALLNEPAEVVERMARERTAGNIDLELFKSRLHRLALALWTTFTRDQVSSIFAASSHRVYLPWREMTAEQRKLALAMAQECENPSPGPKYLTPQPSPHALELVQEFGVVLLGWNWAFGRSSHIKFAEVCRMKPPIYLATDLNLRPETPVGKANRGSPYELSPSDREGVRGYADLERMPFPGKGFRQNFPMIWRETFQQLAERLPFALYSDYFTGKSVGVDNSATPRENSGNPAVMPLEKMHVAEALDTFCSHVGQVWRRKGDALFFRSRSWFVDRLYQAPRDVLGLCRKQLTEKGRLDRDAVDTLAALAWQELAGIDDLAKEESLRAWFRAYFGFHHGLYRLMKVYASLKPEDRDRALGEGVPTDRMGLAQRRAYQEALFIHDGPRAMLAELPPLRFEQRLIKGIPKKRPNLCQILYAPKPGAPDHDQEVIACLYVAFPLKDEGPVL